MKVEVNRIECLSYVEIFEYHTSELKFMLMILFRGTLNASRLFHPAQKKKLYHNLYVLIQLFHEMRDML